MAEVKAAAAAPVPVDPAKLVRNRPTAPCLWFTGDEKGDTILSLPLANLTVTASFHVSTAIVKLSSTWVNTSGKTIDGLFSFPLRGTVTSSRVRVGQGRILETQVVALDEANKAQQSGGETKLNIPSGSVEAYVPDLFRLPVAAVPAGEHVKIDATFIEPLEYSNGRYHFSMPLRFPPGTLPVGLPVNQVVNISGTVDAFVPGIQVFSSSYGLLLTNYPGQISFKAQLPDPNAVEPVNFDVSYNLPSAQIMGTLIKEQDPAPRMMGEEGSFLLMVTPPAPDKVQGVFKRTFVFIIDRSGSMTGRPYEEACRALDAGLKTLREGDAFTVVAFDGKFDSWTQDVVPVNAQNVQDGGNWARRNGPRGGTTEIQQPLNWALQLLSRYDKQSLCFCVLLTDGCVPNERDICQPLTLKEGNPLGNSRILTFGIGTFCNWYFLKMLATLGRGYSDVVVDNESIYPRVTKLVELCAFPVLTNVDVQVAGCDQIELYPMPLPDLFVGAPLLVAGKYRTGGRFPDRLTLSGNIADGRRLALEVLTMVNPLIPVNQVFVKQRLDLLTARAWLTQDKALKAEIVKLSVEQSMPCVYTTMVAYEVNDTRRAEIEAEEKNESQAQADPNKPPAAAPPPPKKGASSATIAACAVGGVLVVGAAVGAAFAFGNVGATAHNLVTPVVGVLGHAGRAIAGFGGAAVHAAGKAIGAAGGAIGHAVSNCGHCECCSCFGNIFGHCGGCSGCGNCLHSIEGVCGHCCSNAFGCIGHGFSKLCGVCCACNCWGSIGSVLGGCFKPLFNCCGSVFGAVVGCCGKLCSENCVKSLTSCCSGIFGCCSKGCGSGFGAVTGFCSKTCWPCVQSVCCFVCKQVFKK